MGGIDAAHVGKLDAQLKLSKADARESKTVIFVGLVVTLTHGEVIATLEIHILIDVSIIGGLVNGLLDPLKRR